MRRDDCDVWERTNPSVPDAATRESNVMAFTKSGVLLGDEIMVLMIMINNYSSGPRGCFTMNRVRLIQIYV